MYSFESCFGGEVKFTGDDIEFIRSTLTRVWNSIAPDLLVDEEDTFTAIEVIELCLHSFERFTEGEDTERMGELAKRMQEVRIGEGQARLAKAVMQHETFGT